MVKDYTHTITIEFLQELWTARKELDARGGDRKSLNANKSNVTNVTFDKSWSNYCSEIGIERMTAHRWLERYNPIEF